jgi:glycosyltransferase involved in cell wall biosynthesis
MKLSLCIAVFNEEKNIRLPLDSAYDLVDEVIIVDGGSTDKTVEIVKSYGDKVKIFHEKNPPMFHVNKQKAIERAKGEWILQLDADEALSENLKLEISNFLQIQNSKFKSQNYNSKVKSNQKINGYYIPRKNYFLGRFLRKGGQYPDYTIRLYRNGVAHFPCKNVHENVEVKGEVGYLKQTLLHYADPNFSRYLMRWHRYNDLDAQKLIKEDRKPNIFAYLLFKPISTFFLIYFRHKGFVDGWQGFVFAFYSSIRFLSIYIKWRQTK